MVSTKTLCQSLMMLSVSYWTRNSTPFLPFNWKRQNEMRIMKISFIDSHRCTVIKWHHVSVEEHCCDLFVIVLRWHQHTSKTFFLLDLSLEAQPIAAPRRSTVISVTIWLVLFCEDGEKEIHLFSKLTAPHSKGTSCLQTKALTVPVSSSPEGVCLRFRSTTVNVSFHRWENETPIWRRRIDTRGH